MDLSHNQLSGDIWDLVEGFCKLIPAGGSLRDLRLNHNQLRGELPPCLMHFQRLSVLTLNNNYFRGPVPDFPASGGLELVVLALHSNSFSGSFPKGLDGLSDLGVLTLRENLIGGDIEGLRLTSPCIDNSKFRYRGSGCGVMAQVFANCGKTLRFLSEEQFEEVRANCPRWCDACPKRSAKVTLQRNRFSGVVPGNISRDPVLALAIMGNMLGSGHEVTSDWIPKEEKQPFLYYSMEVRRSNQFTIASLMAVLFVAIILHRPLYQRLAQSSRCLDGGPMTAVVASSYFAV